MSYVTRIDELVEEALDASRSIEEVCADSPEMLDEVRSRVRKIRKVEEQFDLLFPTKAATPSRDGTRPFAVGPELPSIPGYELQSVLGRGGMGVVYHARHVPLNRSVALKMLLAGSYASQVELMRFVREAEAVAGMRHQHIVQVYDVGEVDGRPYYTMELVDGGSLAQKLARVPLSVREAAETLELLARAVQSAHDGGIVHRDLKPANILLTADGTPKISDFGLARRVDIDDGLTLTGVRIGTPSYMAPEQVTGGAIGPAVDIYALGGLLYEMLTGNPPFRGSSISETERRLISEEPTPPSQINDKVPRDLETICLKCLQKPPAQRYASAAELADDLQRFLRYEPIRARPASPGERALRWVRRNPVWSALIITVAALCGAIVYDATEELALAAARHAEKSRLTTRLESGLDLEKKGRYSEARVLLEKLGDGGHPDLRQRIDAALANLKLIDELDAITLTRVAVADGDQAPRDNRADAERQYAAIFAQHGLGRFDESPEVVARRVRESNIKPALVAAVDDWAVCATTDERRHWLLAVARLADPDPNGWRDRARDPATWSDPATLGELTASMKEVNSSMQLLRALGDRLGAAGLNSVGYREQVLSHHHDDFVANVSLADALIKRDPTEAVRYYQAAVAIRPDAALAHNNLGVVLTKMRRPKDALPYFNAALKIDPRLAVVHYNRGLACAATNDDDAAIKSYRQAIEIESDYAAASLALGELLLQSERPAEAEAALAQALDQLPAGAPLRPQVEQLLKRTRGRSEFE